MPFLYNLVMNKLNFIQPYTDETMIWNSKTNKYELSPAFVKSEMETHYADDNVLDKRIKKNSRKIYNYIKYHSYSGNSYFVDVLLNKTEEGRRFLKDILLEQMEADNETGFNDLSSQPAVNVANGNIIDRDELRRNQISVDTEQIIERNADYFGFNICLMSRFPPALQLYLTRR